MGKTSTVSNAKGNAMKPKKTINKRKPRLKIKKPKPTLKAHVVDNAMDIAKLSKEVDKLKVAEYGQKQMTRQLIENRPGTLEPEVLARVSNGRPVCFLHQAISEETPIYQVGTDAVTGAIEVQRRGRFVQQLYPLLSVDPGSDQFDQLYNLKANNAGVQSGYYHHKTYYNIYAFAKNFNGWMDILLVSPNKQYSRSAGTATVPAENYQLPAGLPGFVNCCGGSNFQYSYNPLFFTVKRLKRVYFNTTIALENQTLKTNPEYYTDICVTNHKDKAHIRSQIRNDNPAPITFLDIPFDQQDWIMFTSSSNQSTDASNLSVKVKRVPVWRDSVGSS